MSILPFVIGTFLSFFFIAFAVEIAIALFRIKKHRVKWMMRLLPIGTLFFSKLSTGHLFNPFHCKSCIQKLFAPELKRYLAEVPDWFHTALLFGFISISAILLVRKIALIMSFHRSLKNLINQAETCHRKIENQSLSDALQKQGVKMLVSEAIQSPMAAYFRTILIPKNLVETLCQDEFEAVVAHELEHLRWKDPITKLLSQICSTLFWWVPTRWWLKRVDQDQEMSADASVWRYSLDRIALASALVKIARNRDLNEPVAFCALAAGNSILNRLRIILEPSTIPLQINLLLCALVGVIAASAILLSCTM